MNDFVIRKNIARFESAMAVETDAEKLKVLRILLEQEKAKIVPPGPLQRKSPERSGHG